jgi:hypothetical protein
MVATTGVFRLCWRTAEVTGNTARMGEGEIGVAAAEQILMMVYQGLVTLERPLRLFSKSFVFMSERAAATAATTKDNE